MPAQLPIQDARSAPFNGPFDLTSTLINAATAPNVEGVWVDVGFAKFHSLEVTGVMSSLGVDIYGSNAPVSPLNQYVVTIGGTAAQNDVLHLVFANQNVPGGSYQLNYTVPATPSLNSIATGIAAAINGDTTLSPLGFTASATNAVVTISFPSASPSAVASPGSPSAPLASNATVLTGSVTGTETITIATSTNGEKIGNTVAALGITQLSVNMRWLTARLTTLTGGSANVSVNWHGVG